MSKSNNKKQQAVDASLVAGLKKDQASLPTLMILGKSYTVAEAVTVLETRAAKTAAAQAAKAARQTAMQAEETEILATKRLRFCPPARGQGTVGAVGVSMS